MFIKGRTLDRERIAGATLLASLLIILQSMIGIWFLDVRVSNIELVDRGLYTIITDNGPINVGEEDILRIERTYTKAAITGESIELNKIYTTKGFIYISSLDPFYKTGNQLINLVDYEGKSVWINSNNTGSEVSLDQLQSTNLRQVKPFSYAIGTSSDLAIVIFSVLSLQYLALSIGGVALIVLIFPLRLGAAIPDQPLLRQDKEHRSDEDHIDTVAK